MRVLAIDPGNTMSAWLLLNSPPFNADKEPNEQVLAMLRQWPVATVDVLALEMVESFGMPVGKEVFATVLWIGRFAEAWEARGGRVQLITRKQVKHYHCGTTRANDANIRAALIDRFGPGKERAVGVKRAPGPLYGLKGDEWSALAIALTAAAQLDSNDAGGMFARNQVPALDAPNVDARGQPVPF